MESRMETRDRWFCLVAIIGFASLTAALVAAHSNPATEYELSIYTGTPATFWIGIAVAYLVSLILAFTATNDWHRLGGLVLGGMASTAVVALSIIRGYYFHGVHDPLTHVGYTRELLAGTMVPSDLLYPGVHTVGAFVEAVVGYSVWQSMLYVPVVVILAFFVFVPLVVGAVIDDDRATTVGAFSAFLLLPMHLILANSVHVHPSSQAIMFTPLVLFLLIKFLRSTGSKRRSGVLTTTGVLFVVVMAAAILYHPQQALNLIALLLAISVIQFVARRRTSRLPSGTHRPVYSLGGISLLLYFGWVFSFPAIFEVGAGAVESTVTYFAGAAAEPGSAVTSQTGALRAIGVSLPVFYLKAYSVSTLYLILAGLALFGTFRSRFGRATGAVDTRSLVRYLGVGVVVAAPVLFVYLVGNVGAYYFRQAGYMLMVVSILGAVGIAYGTEVLSTTRFRTGLRLAMIGSFAVMLVLSTMLLYNSPHVHRANQHVTDARVSGYDVTFQTTDDSAIIDGVRQTPDRYYQALVDTGGSDRLDGTVNSSELHDLKTRRDGDWYLVISRNTYEREIHAYREYRYSRSDLDAIDRQPGVNRVHANGDTKLYYVTGE